MPTQTGTIDLRSGNAVRIATQNSIDSLGGTYIDQSELDIAADNILADVRKEIYEVDPATGLPTSEARWESAIDVAARGIKTEVSETYATKDEASITTTATGEIATLDGVATAPLASLVAYGRSVQSGSPTPSAPVAVGSVDSLSIEVSGRNILKHEYGPTYPNTSNGVTATLGSDGGITLNGTASGTFYNGVYGNSNNRPVPSYLVEGQTYTLSGGTEHSSVHAYFYTASKGVILNATGTFTVPSGASYCWILVQVDNGVTISGETAYPQLELGSTATEYEQHQGAITPIDLQGHQLRSLPDGTHDELSVDSAGNVSMVRRVKSVSADTSGWTLGNNGAINSHGISYVQLNTGLPGSSMVEGAKYLMTSLPKSTGTWSSATGREVACNQQSLFYRFPSSGTATVASALADMRANGFEALIPYVTVSTIDLGTIAMPQVSDGSTVWLSASMVVEATYTAWMPNSEALRSSISQTADGVLATISQSYATKDEVATLVRAYGDGVLVCKKGQTIGALINADGSFDVVSLTWEGDVPKVEVDGQNKVVPLTRIAADGATFGKASGFHMAIETVGEGTSQTQRLGFYDEAGTLVAYMQNGLMYVANTMVLHTMRVGEDDETTQETEGWEWKYQTADSATPGNLTLRWVG